MKLEICNITKKYGNTRILNNISFKIEEGMFFSIFGPSGSGKSTILKIITGLESADIGKVFLDGIDISSIETYKRDIAFVFQSSLLFPHLTVRENISFGLQVRKKSASEIEERVAELLKLLKIEELGDRYPANISGGQQQRVSIARALAPNPALILMDEPFSALDVNLRNEMGDLIKSLQVQLKLTVIFVTHDLNEALKLSDTLVLINNGNLIQIGDARQVYTQPVNEISADLMGSGNWFSGKIENEVFYTDIGQFSASNKKDGRAWLFIRPHQIKISRSQVGVPFTIVEVNRLGKESQIIVNYHSQKVTIEVYFECNFKSGETVYLVFDNKNLHFIYKDNL